MDYEQVNLLSKYAKNYCHKRIRQAGVNDTEHKICTFLYFHSEVCQDTIAEAMRLDKTTASKAISVLESRGLLARNTNPENRRKNTLRITEAGKQTVADIVTVYDDWFAQVAACLTDCEQKQFVHLCRKLLLSAERINKGESPNTTQCQND